MVAQVDPATPTALIEQLASIVGKEYVLHQENERRFYGADFSDRPFQTPIAVVRPNSSDEVASVINAVRRAGYAIVGRGGGMSYTRAHQPERPSVIVDLGRMNRILEVNPHDRYVIVETGVTWAQLFEAVRPHEVWVPHLGTLSGLHATVGGGLSQQVTGLGQGYLTDYVLGLEVALADGSLLRTGSWAAHGNKPVLREFGPDLNGLFLVDSGAFGIKTQAALRLDPMPRGTAYGVFRFEDRLAMVDAMSEVGALGLASNVIGSDAAANRAMGSMPAPPPAVVQDMAKRVMNASTSRLHAMRQLASAARGKGLSYLKDLPNALVLIADSTDTPAAERVMVHLGKVVRGFGGTPQPIGVALGMRHSPFNPIQPLMFGPKGESTIPSNALVPLSQGRTLAERVDGIVKSKATELQAHGIEVGNNYLVTRHVIGIEPLITYPATLSEYRLNYTFPHMRDQLAAIRAPQAAFETALALRSEIISAARALGSAHLQIGRTYPLREALEGTRTWNLLNELKRLLDPDNTINPGVLGLD